MSFMDEFNFWLNDDYFDQATKDELLKIKDNEGEIEERFYKELEFGTGGLRGVIGAGTNRMNIYTVRKASQGLANYIIKANGQKKGIAIAYDSRFMSPEFADEAALCMAANGIKAYVFESLRPPELSSRQAIIRQNTTDIRYTGRTAHRLRRPRIRTLSMK